MIVVIMLIIARIRRDSDDFFGQSRRPQESELWYLYRSMVGIGVRGLDLLAWRLGYILSCDSRTIPVDSGLLAQKLTDGHNLSFGSRVSDIARVWLRRHGRAASPGDVLLQ